MQLFSSGRLSALAATRYLYLRAGETHRFIPVWVVVVGGRALVRSWNDEPRGWYRAFLRDRRGAVRLDDTVVAVEAVRVRSARLEHDADRAYAAKYTTRANQPYVRGFATDERRAHTLELRPASRRPAAASTSGRSRAT